MGVGHVGDLKETGLMKSKVGDSKLMAGMYNFDV